MVSAIDPAKPRDGVPARKSDLRRNLRAAKAEIEELQLRKIENGAPIDMEGSLLKSAVLADYSEVVQSQIINQGQIILDISTSNVFEIRLTRSVVSMILRNVSPVNQARSITFIVAQDGIGGWDFTWPEEVMWPGGLSPSVSKDPNATDIYALFTINGGTSWFGFVGGKGFF